MLYESDITRAFKSRQSVMRAVRRPWCKSYNWSSILSQGHSGQSGEYQEILLGSKHLFVNHLDAK